MELLELTNKTISEICFEVGFSGFSYFTKTFHKIYGCIPTEYRSKNCNNTGSSLTDASGENLKGNYL